MNFAKAATTLALALLFALPLVTQAQEDPGPPGLDPAMSEAAPPPPPPAQNPAGLEKPGVKKHAKVKSKKVKKDKAGKSKKSAKSKKKKKHHTPRA